MLLLPIVHYSYQCRLSLMRESIIHVLKCMSRDFPGSPVVKTSPSNGGDAGSIPGWGAKIPYASSWPKNQKNKNRRYIVTNSIKTLKKNGPHQKKKKMYVYRRKCLQRILFSSTYRLQESTHFFKTVVNREVNTRLRCRHSWWEHIYCLNYIPINIVDLINKMMVSTDFYYTYQFTL